MCYHWTGEGETDEAYRERMRQQNRTLIGSCENMANELTLENRRILLKRIERSIEREENLQIKNEHNSN